MNKERELISLMESVLNVEEGTIDMDSTMADVEQWDSLTHVILMGELESKLGVSIPIDEAIELSSVKQIVEYLDKN